LIAPAYIFAFFCAYRENEHGIFCAIGLALFAAGFVLRVWSQMHLHYRLKEHKILTMTGPYTMVRNPIYIGNTLILVGTTLIAQLAWFAPIMLLACMITYALVVRYEERHLSEKYGTPYRDFLSSVPRWVPRIKNMSAPAAHSHKRFLLPSVLAELHILLLLILPLTKELLNPYS
jgi:protein-S-isoprenylcysteine O-methyltransferase Ste14